MSKYPLQRVIQKYQIYYWIQAFYNLRHRVTVFAWCWWTFPFKIDSQFISTIIGFVFSVHYLVPFRRSLTGPVMSTFTADTFQYLPFHDGQYKSKGKYISSVDSGDFFSRRPRAKGAHSYFNGFTKHSVGSMVVIPYLMYWYRTGGGINSTVSQSEMKGSQQSGSRHFTTWSEYRACSTCLETHAGSGFSGTCSLPNRRTSHSTGLASITVFDQIPDKIQQHEKSSFFPNLCRSFFLNCQYDLQNDREVR